MHNEIIENNSFHSKNEVEFLNNWMMKFMEDRSMTQGDFIKEYRKEFPNSNRTDMALYSFLINTFHKEGFDISECPKSSQNRKNGERRVRFTCEIPEAEGELINKARKYCKDHHITFAAFTATAISEFFDNHKNDFERERINNEILKLQAQLEALDNGGKEVKG